MVDYEHDNIARHEKLPEGFKEYAGEGCPFNPEEFVHAAVLTNEGIGIAPLQRAKLHDWEWSTGKPEIGDVIGYLVR
jgi:hypothetical protein